MIVDDAFIAELIDDREKGWSDRPPDPPTNMGMSLPLWDRYCMATGQTFRCGKRHLRAATREDAFKFYRWYFEDRGLLGQDIPLELWEHILDLHVLHSPDGVRNILDGASRAYGGPFMTDLDGFPTADVAHAFIALSRIRYMTEIAQQNLKMRRFHFGWVIRALKMGRLWPRGDIVDA